MQEKKETATATGRKRKGESGVNNGAASKNGIALE
jgi:hypothetical protein